MNSSLWRTATIFISSTFKDMMGERDIINHIVLPRLNEIFQPFNIMVHLIDMRWGINTEAVDDSERESHILKVCLDEIDRSRPFFIGLLGHRYGWIPPKTIESLRYDWDSMQGRSVTEIEMQYGALESKETMKRSIFCIRNYPNNIPDELKEEYFENNIDRLKAQLNLRQRVEEYYSGNGFEKNLIKYNSKWEINKLAPDEKFANELIEKLTERIKIEFNLEANEEAMPNQICKIMDIRLMILLYNKLQRSRYLKKIYPTPGEIIRIIGPSLCGKSVLMAQIAQHLKSSPECIPIYYDAYFEPACRSPRVLLNYLCQKIAEILGQEWADFSPDMEESTLVHGTKIIIDQSLLELEKYLNELCSKCAEKNTLPIFIIDSADMLIGTRYSQRLLFSNPYCCIVFSSQQDSRLASDETIYIEDFDIKEAQMYIDMYFKDTSKQIHNQVKECMLNKVRSSENRYNPGKLSVILYWVKNLDAEDFRNISFMKGEGEDNIRKYMLNLVNSLPPDYGTLFEMMVESAAKMFGHSLVTKSLKAFALSLHGIKERELKIALGENWDCLKFAEFRRMMAPFISYSPITHSWNLLSKTTPETLSETMKKEVVEFHKIMTEHLKMLDKNDAIRQRDLPYHAINANDYNLCGNLLAHPDATTSESFNLSLNGFGKEELIEIGYKILKSLHSGDRPAASVFLILNIFLRQEFLSKKDTLEFACSVVNLLTPDQTDISEYQLSCLSILWSELALMAKYDGDTRQYAIVSDALLDIGSIKYKRFPSNDSKQSLYKGLVAMASYYMETGNYEKSMEYYTKISNMSNK